MASKMMSTAREFVEVLRCFQGEGNRNLSSYEEDIQILKMNGDKFSAADMYTSSQTIFVCEKVVPKISEPDALPIDDSSNCSTDEADKSFNVLQTELGPQPLTVTKARELLSLYTLALNVSVSGVDNNTTLHPLWVRCDMSDPAGTTWFGADPVYTSNKIIGVKLYSITCRGSTTDKRSFITLEELKQEHRKRHHSSPMGIKGHARYNLFGSTVVENTIIESQSSVTVDFKWGHVESVFEVPPLSSTATLNIKISSGDMRSPMFELYRELEFLKTLADGLRTGETEWMEPLETTSAADLIKAYLTEIVSTVKTTPDQAGKTTETSKTKPEAETPIFNSFLERGDLDFVEQLWVRMRKSVTSYQDIGDCLKLVIDALKYDGIKPWIHRDSSSSLSKLILQSYHQQIQRVPLTGAAPVNMLLEMGLDKLRKDYINYLIGEELTTLNHLCYYLSSECDHQEQVVRLRKLHHLLEIIVTCSTFLGLPYDRLFLLTQSCLQHYKTHPYDEEHEFKLQIKPALINHFYQNEHPLLWGVELSSGHAPREVKTVLQLSDRPLVDHITFDTDYPNETVNGDCEDPAFYSTLEYCSLVNFA